MPPLPVDVAIGRWKRRGRAMRTALETYVKRVGELAEHVRGNEPATKRSPAGPRFTILGYGLVGPYADQPARAQNRTNTDFRFLLTSVRTVRRFERGTATDFGPRIQGEDEPIPISVRRSRG
jgi:hypothetical protein